MKFINFNTGEFFNDVFKQGKDAEIFEQENGEKEFKNEEIKKAALRYKESLVEWRHYQAERATPEQIKSWLDKYPYANIGRDHFSF